MNRIINSVSTYISYIRTFLVDAGFTIEEDLVPHFGGTLLVVETKEYTYKYIFFENNNYLYVTAAEDFDSSKPFYSQYHSNTSDDITVNNSHMYITYVLTKAVSDLYCNSNGDTLMFTTIDVSNVVRHTQFVFLGILDNLYTTILSSMFIGGTHIIYITAPLDFTGASFVNTIFQEDNSLEDNQYRVMFSVHEKYNTDVKGLLHKSIWISDTLSPYPLICSMYHTSVLSSGAGLPTYYDMSSFSRVSPTSNYNRYNGATLCLPILFFERQDPSVLGMYAYLGRSAVICFIDMYNISSGSIFTTHTDTGDSSYQCYAVNTRRNKGSRGFMGYGGIGFLMEDD